MNSRYFISPEGLFLIASIFTALRVTWFLRQQKSIEILFVALALTVAGGVNLAQSNTFLSLTTTFQRGVLVFLIILTLEPIGYWGYRLLFRRQSGGKRANEQLIEEIISGAQVLSNTKTGALIAFERNDGLDKLAQSGTPIDSDVKRELLTAIFSKDSLTHDGGAIIQNGRLAYCSAVFPLTFSLDIDKNLGTRHRAAIGLTESTDAVCLIVSEEEGTISLAKEGQIFYNLDPKSIRRDLMKWLKPARGRKIYPLHRLRTFRLTESTTTTLRFSKSPALQFYDLTLHLFWLFISANLILSNGVPVTRESVALFFSPQTLATQPWNFIPAVLALIQLGFLVTHYDLYFDLNFNAFTKKTALLFLNLRTVKRPLNDFVRTIVKRDRQKAMSWSLYLQDRKKKWLKLDSAGSSNGLLRAAKKIHELLKIELVNQS